MTTVSIIMPYYNVADYIFETVDTILNKTYKDRKLIIIDDCSPSPVTGEVLDRVAKLDSRVIVFKAKKMMVRM